MSQVGLRWNICIVLRNLLHDDDAHFILLPEILLIS